ncbi:MAG TPA: hypothetical protein GXX55_10295 [Firmicutes bacterium]|nr:hypothetical protein [Bacillota bacterium]
MSRRRVQVAAGPVIVAIALEIITAHATVLAGDGTIAWHLGRGDFALSLEINESYNYVLVLASWAEPRLTGLLSQLPAVKSVSPWIPTPIQIVMPAGLTDAWACGVGTGYPIGKRKDGEPPKTPVRLLSGRFFIPADLTGQAKIGVISRRLMLRAGFTDPMQVLGKSLLVSFDGGATRLEIKVVGVYQYETGPLVQSGGPAIGEFPKSVELFMGVKEEDLLIPYSLVPSAKEQRHSQGHVVVTKPGEAARTAEFLRQAFFGGLLTPQAG